MGIKLAERIRHDRAVFVDEIDFIKLAVHLFDSVHSRGAQSVDGGAFVRKTELF